MTLVVVPVTIAEAKRFCAEHHRHAPTIQGGLFAVGLAEAPGPRPLVGVAIVGRPSRLIQDGWTCVITRLATDGSTNACSMLYGAAWRAARAIGFRRARTYTLVSESGASLRAIGARRIGLTEGRSHSRAKRPRTDKHVVAPRVIWELGIDPARLSETAP